MKTLLITIFAIIFFFLALFQSKAHAFAYKTKLNRRNIHNLNVNLYSRSITSHDNVFMKAAIPSPWLTSAESFRLLLSKSTLNMNKFRSILKKTNLKWQAIVIFLSTLIGRLGKKVTKEITKATSNMETGWFQRGYGSSLSRTIEVWLFVISFALKWVQVNKLRTGDPAIYSEAQTKLAIMLRDKALALGPTFIKLGQLLSTRIDILPREYVRALELLQDKVPGFSGDLAVEIIERELGRPINELYDTFNRTALAAASLGQVHRATLNGKDLCVKIQRQGLKSLFDMDLKNIRILAVLLNKFDPKSDGATRDWLSIYDESARLLYREIDYEAEALNSIRFKDNFADQPWIKVPEVLLNMTSKSIVTMEYVPGIKINDIERIEAAGIDRKLLAKRSAESYLTQLCRHGFFHCDPHPGNLACDAVEGGRLIYYDFGMMDELKPQVKSGFVNLIFGIYDNNPKEVCNALEEIDVLRKGVDRFSVEKITRVFLQEFTNTISTKDSKWAGQLSKEEQKELRRQRRVQLGADLFSVGSDVPFKFPPTFTFVFRAFTSLDGIGKGLDPKYDLTRLAQPYLKELADLKDGSAFLSAVKVWGKKLGLRPIDISQAVQSPRKMAYVEEVVSKLEQGDLKLRVRVLDSERAFKRMEITQSNFAFAAVASTFLNMAILLSVTATAPSAAAIAAMRASFCFAGFFGLQVPIGLFKLKSFDKKFDGLNL